MKLKEGGRKGEGEGEGEGEREKREKESDRQTDRQKAKSVRILMAQTKVESHDLLNTYVLDTHINKSLPLKRQCSTNLPWASRYQTYLFHTLHFLNSPPPFLPHSLLPEGVSTGAGDGSEVRVCTEDGMCATSGWTPLQVRVVLDETVGNQKLVLLADLWGRRTTQTRLF